MVHDSACAYLDSGIPCEPGRQQGGEVQRHLDLGRSEEEKHQGEEEEIRDRRKEREYVWREEG